MCASLHVVPSTPAHRPRATQGHARLLHDIVLLTDDETSCQHLPHEDVHVLDTVQVRLPCQHHIANAMRLRYLVTEI
jgi:hypothetical protein